jgi:hypothetical protein
MTWPTSLRGLLQVCDILSLLTEVIAMRFNVAEPDRSNAEAAYEDAHRFMEAHESAGHKAA